MNTAFSASLQLAGGARFQGLGACGLGYFTSSGALVFAASHQGTGKLANKSSHQVQHPLWCWLDAGLCSRHLKEEKSFATRGILFGSLIGAGYGGARVTLHLAVSSCQDAVPRRQVECRTLVAFRM